LQDLQAPKSKLGNYNNRERRKKDVGFLVSYSRSLASIEAKRSIQC
jgi:hypothetical protein